MTNEHKSTPRAVLHSPAGYPVKVTNATALLALYFAHRNDWPITSPLGSDPSASRCSGGSFGKMLALVIDVGTCLDALTEDQQSAIAEKWVLFYQRDDAENKASCMMSDALDALRSGDVDGHSRLIKRVTLEHSRGGTLSADMKRVEERKVYKDAMDAFRVEVRARDLYARAVCGDKVGIG